MALAVSQNSSFTTEKGLRALLGLFVLGAGISEVLAVVPAHARPAPRRGQARRRRCAVGTGAHVAAGVGLCRPHHRAAHAPEDSLIR
jgi:hypothetical protein